MEIFWKSSDSSGNQVILYAGFRYGRSLSIWYLALIKYAANAAHLIFIQESIPDFGIPSDFKFKLA